MANNRGLGLSLKSIQLEDRWGARHYVDAVRVEVKGNRGRQRRGTDQGREVKESFLEKVTFNQDLVKQSQQLISEVFKK